MKYSADLGYLDPVVNRLRALLHCVNCKDALLDPTNHLVMQGAELAEIGGASSLVR